MGHSVEFYDYSTKVSKGEIFADMDEIVIYNGDDEGHTGLNQNIRFYDNVCLDTREEAKNFIEKHDKGWCDQLAVKYKDCGPVNSKKLIDLKKQYDTTIEKIKKSKGFYFANHKSKLITCKNCESKLAVSFLNTNNCPVCRKDLRPETEQARIDGLYKKKGVLEDRIQEEEQRLKKKQAKKGKEMWLVKIEYHC